MKGKKILVTLIAIILVLEVVFPVLKINFNNSIARELSDYEWEKVLNKSLVGTSGGIEIYAERAYADAVGGINGEIFAEHGKADDGFAHDASHPFRPRA